MRGRQLTPVLVALLVVVASILGMMQRPPTGSPRQTVDYVIIAGAPGLRWDDLSAQETPTLWSLAERGSIGALSVRSARRPTCPADGWLTLGAGNYAVRPGGLTQERCPDLEITVERPDPNGAYLPDQRAVAMHNRENLPWGAVPGALAEALRCTTAVGPGAAIAAARPFGRVDRYVPALPPDAASTLAACRLNVVDLGVVAGERPGEREAAVRRADEILGQVLAARPERSLVLVAGLSDTDQASRLHVAIADGPGWSGGWLTSASTGRPGYLPLVDLAPTALAALGEPLPRQLFAGHPADHTSEGRPGDLRAAVARLADADREAGAQQRVAGRFFVLLALAQLVVFVAAVPLLRRARRYGGPYSRPTWPASVLRTGEVVLTAAALAIPAALLADALPWWRSSRPGLVFAAAFLTALAATTAAVMGGPLRRVALGPVVGVGAIAAAVVGLDLLTGASLQLNGVAGYSALEGGRYAGVGTVGLGVFIAGLLLVAGVLAQRVPRPWRRALVVLAGAVGVLLVGSPYLGADAGGAVALTAGVCIAAALSTGGWLTLARLASAVVAGLAVTTGLAVLDLRRPPEERDSLGRFLTHLSEGSGGPVVHRSGAANVIAFATSPLTLLAIGAGLFLWLALMRDWGGAKRLFGLYPAVRAGFAGVAVASVIAGLFNGAALNVAGAAAATALPLATLAALRVLVHADDRTVVGPAPDGHPPATATASRGRGPGAAASREGVDADAADRTARRAADDAVVAADGTVGAVPGDGDRDPPGERAAPATAGDVLP